MTAQNKEEKRKMRKKKTKKNEEGSRGEWLKSEEHCFIAAPRDGMV